MFKRKLRGNSAVAMMHITEDTPPDMLAGAMDLTVHLPNGKSVKMSVERSTPMMDVLVQITTAQHLQLSSHTIQALGMPPSSQCTDRVLPYKPNTPIGTLDTQHIRVLPKGRSLPVSKNVPPGHQPFESTFRLRVHLPRNQLYVSRVSMNVKLEEIMTEVCDEKNLDPAKYEFRHPANLDEVLDPKLTLNHYKITEIYFVSKGSARLSQAFSASDIMALRKDDERKQSKSGGVFNFFKRGKTSNGSGSLSSDNRSISPTHSDDSRSVTPPAVQQQIIGKDAHVEKPKPPLRKRRPAPKPPQIQDEQKADSKPKKTESGLTICHSRNSSDSSGYHEASILSDNANTSLPRRPQTMIISENEGRKLNGEHSKSTSNLTTMFSKSKSTSSLAFAGRKKKAPPPPPGLTSASSVTNLQKASPVVASPVEQPDSIPPTPQDNVTTPEIINYTTNSPPESIASSLATTLSSNIETDMIPSKENSEIIENEVIDKPQVQNEIEPETASAIKNFVPIAIETPKEENELDTEWQYQLPSPPTAFRDTSPIIDTMTNYESTENFKSDSVVTSPELFEKLKLVKESQSELSEAPSEEKPILNKLSLENLEKRKSLVYNRELATSFRYKDEESTVSSKTESISSKRSSVMSELEEVINKPIALTRSTSKAGKNIQTAADNSLPNFTITTYDMPKKKINIFEDDSIRSNAEVGVRPVAENPISLDLNIHETEDVVDHIAPNKSEEVIFRRPEAIKINEEVPLRKSEEIFRKPETVKINEEVSFRRPETVKINEEVSFRKPEEIFRKYEENCDRKSEDIFVEKNIRKPDEVFRKSEDVFKKPQEVNKYRARTYMRSNTYERGNSVGRSESFSMKNWVPSNPVKRSKSQVAINQYKEEEKFENTSSNLSKSNSLFDVSGLQSLEVMRLIQNKLKTPSNSTEQLEEKHIEVIEKEEEKPKQTQAAQPYVYRGPPSINLGTWSDRPKSQISLKEDTDYKFNSSKFVTADSNPEISLRKVPSFKREDFRENGIEERNNVSIKVNGFEPITSQKSGNVVIKIGESEKPNEDNFSKRFINHTTAVGYRKPLGNINKVERAPRPHSIAYDDTSRLPKVCSVELKKPFKGLYANTSITQIGQTDTKPFRHSQIYVTSESPASVPVNNFVQAPVVKGFKQTNGDANMNMWNSYKTLPNKPTPKITPDLTTNQNVPFSQNILKRTESNKNLQNTNNNNIFGTVIKRNSTKSFNNNRFSTGTLPNIVTNNTFKNNIRNEDKAPPPPVMPKVTGFRQSNKKFEHVQDPKEQLLDAIRNFGGKKGLKSLKV